MDHISGVTPDDSIPTPNLSAGGSVKGYRKWWLMRVLPVLTAMEPKDRGDVNIAKTMLSIPLTAIHGNLYMYKFRRALNSMQSDIAGPGNSLSTFSHTAILMLQCML